MNKCQRVVTCELQELNSSGSIATVNCPGLTWCERAEGWLVSDWTGCSTDLHLRAAVSPGDVCGLHGTSRCLLKVRLFLLEFLVTGW